MDIAQIQIMPVDNGFFVQCVNADGSNSSNPRRVATTRDELEKIVKDIAETLYTKQPPPQPGLSGMVTSPNLAEQSEAQNRAEQNQVSPPPDASPTP